MGRKRGKNNKNPLERKARTKIAWNEYGPLAAYDLQIHWRGQRLKEMTAKDMTFIEQRKWLDQQMVMK